MRTNATREYAWPAPRAGEQGGAKGREKAERKKEKTGEKGKERRRARARPVATPIYFVLQLFRSNPANLLKCRPARPRPSARYLFLSFLFPPILFRLCLDPPPPPRPVSAKNFSLPFRSARPRATMLKDTIAVYSFHPPGIIPLIKGNESRIDSPSERWLYNTPWNEACSWLISVLILCRWRWFCIDGIYCVDVYCHRDKIISFQQWIIGKILFQSKDVVLFV